MFFWSRLTGYLRNRGRLLFRYHDGARWRRADPLRAGLDLERAEPDYAALLAAVHEEPSKVPAGPVREALQKDQNAAGRRLIAAARKVFGLPELTDAAGLGDGEAMGVLIAYFLFMEGLADAASFTSRPRPSA